MSTFALPHGIVLPESVLDAGWFAVFATAVAFNTIVYLGLTLSKVVPWPTQVHPSRARALLPAPMWKEQSMPVIRRQAATLPEDPFRELRSGSVLANVPRALALTGALLLLVALINSAIDAGRDGGLRVIALAYGLAMIVLSLILARTRARAALMVWLWAIAMTILVATMAWEAARLDSALSITYAIIAMTITPPIALSWRAAVVTGGLQLVAILVSAYLVEAVNTALWGVAALAALTAGCVLLHLRLNILDNLSLEQMRIRRLQTTDALTDCLSRPGLLVVAPPILAAAQKAGTGIYLAVIDVRSLQSCNADYGTDYGDRVLQALARALADRLPDAAIARWDGDAFAALGIGSPPEADELARDIDEALGRSGVWLGKPAVTVQVGTTAGAPGTDAIGRLADLASAHMRPAKGS